MWSSPQSSELVGTGCRRSLSVTRSPSGSTCESLWLTSGWKHIQSEWVSGVLTYCCLFIHSAGSVDYAWTGVCVRHMRTSFTQITKVIQVAVQLTSGTCVQFLSPHYMEYDALHLVCLSRSECWQSPSCHRLTWMSCRSHLSRALDTGWLLVFQNQRPCSNTCFRFPTNQK